MKTQTGLSSYFALFHESFVSELRKLNPMRITELGMIGIATVLLNLASCDGDATTSDIPGTVQAESATVKNGGQSIQRSNADGATAWHLDLGGEIQFTFNNISLGNYSVVTRYSNDDTGRGDTIAVLVDGVLKGTFRTQDTGDGGAGWNIFVTSSVVDLGTLTGTATITIRIISSDGYGVDLDSFAFTQDNS